jgi:uncharacterized Zn-binding protein involved in type VI secretion
MKKITAFSLILFSCVVLPGTVYSNEGESKQIDMGSTSGGRGFTQWLAPVNDPEFAERVSRGMGARDRTQAASYVLLEFTYPAGKSPSIFPKGWVFGAKCIANPGQSNEQDLSAHVKWSGTGEFDPPVGALSCPSFSTPGTHTITIAAEVDGKIHQQSITVSVVSFFATNGSFKYAAIGDKVTGQPHGHGCPACPHADINGVIVSGSPNVLLGGLPAARKGDTGVHCCCCGPNTFTIEEGDPNVLIDGRPAARLGDKTMHCATAPGKIVAIRDHYNRSEAP